MVWRLANGETSVIVDGWIEGTCGCRSWCSRHGRSYQYGRIIMRNCFKEGSTTG